ncbi:MAG: AmmeMemoRadiSam system protein A [Lentisphaerota bacterium]
MSDLILTHDEERYLLRVARNSIENGFSSAAMPQFRDATPEMLKPCGAFVTLHIKKQLRGCIGLIESNKSLVQTVYRMAQSAAFDDPRFSSLRRQELDLVDIEISALSTPMEISSYLGFQVGEHGVILKKGSSQAVFLPQVALEQGWDREETLTHLAMKAGLPPDGWHDGCTWRVFTATVFSEGSLLMG